VRKKVSSYRTWILVGEEDGEERERKKGRISYYKNNFLLIIIHLI